MAKVFFKRYGLTLLGGLLGALGGFLYWRFVGCASGTCPITSSPLYSSLWGAAMGVRYGICIGRLQNLKLVSRKFINWV